eukprot:GHRR01005472.1.p3 GENE.GHRR01005472.1~~GHRR01005472.1.p3  ORF type:complete len:128 (+),score=21.89 GHRR01005472.1:1543-1926(+)
MRLPCPVCSFLTLVSVWASLPGIANMIRTWLDEEWAPLEAHQQLGQAAANAYRKCRKEGQEDMGSLVLGLASELLTFNYRETFTDAFEVSNKVVEMLMMRSGVEVCCTTSADKARLERFSSQGSQQG